jgi:hypothetical protein
MLWSALKAKAVVVTDSADALRLRYCLSKMGLAGLQDAPLDEVNQADSLGCAVPMPNIRGFELLQS